MYFLIYFDQINSIYFYFYISCQDAIYEYHAPKHKKITNRRKKVSLRLDHMHGWKKKVYVRVGKKLKNQLN